ncbi:MAG: DUF1566 domain-containing protein [Candidatus Scalindua sp.]|nr:DUF1566 domain-containing protein [Candidatus Scalindua sp.]
MKNYLPNERFLIICFFLLFLASVSCADAEQDTLPSLPDVSVKGEQDREKNEAPEHVILRSSYRNLSASQVEAIPYKNIRKLKKWGFYGSSTLKRDYVEKTIMGDKVVIEATTGLMWHQSGSENNTKWENAKKWVQELNRKGYAGYQDWRLPTVDEAVSLLESDRKSNNLYIAPIFDKNQLYIWTGDGFLEYSAWVISFRSALVTWSDSTYRNYVRPVRTIQ